MKIEIWTDDSCKFCKENLKYFGELEKQHKEVYMNMNMKTYELIDGILLIPDYNSCGYLTHFHFVKASLKNLKNVIEKIESQKRDSKKILEIKKKHKHSWIKSQ